MKNMEFFLLPQSPESAVWSVSPPAMT